MSRTHDYIPAGAITHDVEVEVPPGYPPGVLCHLEDCYRSFLWPRLRGGFLRWGRRFRWLKKGTILRVLIIDVPARGGDDHQEREDAEEIQERSLREMWGER